MTKIEKQLEKIKRGKKIGLMTHVVIGCPSLQETILLVKMMEKAGVDLVELQIPFSDPLADGQTIMEACDASLQDGTKVNDCFEVMKTLTKEVQIPLLFMAYYNTLFSYGARRFIRKAKKVGCAGLIVPDLPPEEEKEEQFIHYCHQYDLHHIRVLSPASTDERIKKNAKIASGFIYLVSRFGTTGAKNQLEPRLKKYIKKIKRYTDLPLAIGFGLSKKRHLEALQGVTEIAVVGSALLNIINKHRHQKSYLQKIQKFLEGLIDKKKRT